MVIIFRTTTVIGTGIPNAVIGRVDITQIDNTFIYINCIINTISVFWCVSNTKFWL